MFVRMGDLSSFRISWIGTGVMGLSMCGHLLGNGARVSVFTRTRDKAQPLLDRGARWVGSPREAAEQSDIVCTMVGFPADVRDVYFSEAGGYVLVELPGGGINLVERSRARVRIVDQA